MATKQCCSCKEHKPASNEFFSKNKLGKYGLNSKCKICDNAYTKQYFKTDKGKTTLQKSYNKLGAGVYEITNLIIGKNYIGETLHLNRRKCEHFSIYNINRSSNPHLQEDIIKYSPDAFSFTILEQLPKNKKTLLEKEKYYINKLKPTYNIKTS